MPPDLGLMEWKEDPAGRASQYGVPTPVPTKDKDAAPHKLRGMPFKNCVDAAITSGPQGLCLLGCGHRGGRG